MGIAPKKKRPRFSRLAQLSLLRAMSARELAKEASKTAMRKKKDLERSMMRRSTTRRNRYLTRTRMISLLINFNTCGSCLDAAAKTQHFGTRLHGPSVLDALVTTNLLALHTRLA